MNNKKAAAYRNKNHVQAQTQSNTENLHSLGQLIIPLSAKVFDLEKKLQRMENQLQQAKTNAALAEYKAVAIQRILGLDGDQIRSNIVSLQKEDFQKQSDADDKARNLLTVDGPAKEGQIALISGKIFKGDLELQNEEVIGSKITLGDDDLYKGIDSGVFGMLVGETKSIPFSVNEQEYSIALTLEGLREHPAKSEETSNEETQVN
jgi:hypothetical protein